MKPNFADLYLDLLNEELWEDRRHDFMYLWHFLYTV